MLGKAAKFEDLVKEGKSVSAKVRLSLRLELYRFIVHSFLAKYSTEITTFLSKAEKKEQGCFQAKITS